MQDQLTEPRGMDETWLSLPLTLSPEAEKLTGADYEPMLYVAAVRDPARSRVSSGSRAHLVLP